MEISKSAVGVLAACCIAAGAGGFYLTTRGSELSSAAAVAEAPVASPDPSAPIVEQSAAIGAGDTHSVRSVGRTLAVPAVERRTAPLGPGVSREPQAASADSRSAPRFDSQPLPAPSLETPSAAPPVPEAVRPFEPEAILAAEPALPEFEELIVSADSVVGLRVETSTTSEDARVEDDVVARVTRDLRVGDRVVIPAGAEARGAVTLVDRGGRLRDSARLGVRFTSVVLADGTRIPLETETIYRGGDAPGGESAAKIGGGAIGGAIIGGIFGGAKGAVIGGSAGAGTGTAAVLAGGRNPAALPSGALITVRIVKPVTVTVEK